MADCGDKRDGDIVAVDFLSLLPAELVLQIALALSARDVTRCLLVCRVWCSRLCQLDPYWRVACRRTGLLSFMVRKFGLAHKTSRELFLAAQNHMRGLAAPPPITRSLAQGYPFDVRYSYQYASRGLIVGTLYRDFQPREMVVENVGEGRVTRTHTLQFAFERRPENRVVWGHLLVGGVYVCATASGRWSLYDLRTHATPLSPIYTWLGEPLYDTDLQLGCCGRCGLVVTAKLVSFHSTDKTSFWDLRFVHLTSAKRPSHMLRFKLYHGNKDIIGRRVPYGKRKVWLVSDAPPTAVTCSNHLLLLQWANSVASYVFSWKEESAILSRTPYLSYIAPCDRLDASLMNTGGLNTELVFSSDLQLLGMVFQAQLHVWDLWSGRKLSCADLPSPIHETFEQIRLLALGHLYSIIGLEFSTSLLVVLTHTGHVVTRCDSFAQQHSHMVPPYTELLCVCEEQWLSDISTPCSPHCCTVVFWNRTNRSLESVQFGGGCVTSDKTTPPRVARRKAWWKVWQ